MGLLNETNLKSLIEKVPHNALVTTKWLEEQGFSRQLLSKYTKNNWLKKLTNGVFVKIGDEPSINGAIYALQEQLKSSIHIGGITALDEYYKKMHNIPFKRKQQLFGYRGEKLPKWFKTLYGQNTELNRTTFLPKNIGFKEQSYGNFSIKIPTLERSILEMLYLVPEKITLNEAYQIIETITTVKPTEFEILLEECSSVKVKRLFLYMAEEVNFNWFKRLNLTKINLGKGVREITKGGKHNKKYNIIIGDIEEI